MNKNVQRALLGNIIAISILILMCTGLCMLFTAIPYHIITLVLQLAI